MRIVVVGMLALSLGCGSGLRVGQPARTMPRSAGATMAAKPWETANVPRGKVEMNPFENLKQMQDQRVAGCSHSAPLAQTRRPLPCRSPCPDGVCAAIGSQPRSWQVHAPAARGHRPYEILEGGDQRRR